MQAPVMVMNTNTKRETGRKAQLTNIQAAKVPFHSRRPSSSAINSSLLFRLSPKSSPLPLDPSPCSKCCSIPWEESS